MIIQKLRLQHGWSQQQLAEMSGLSTRTIQRIENGKTPSVESVKSLAAVFEVDFLTLQGALAMNTETTASSSHAISATQLADENANIQSGPDSSKSSDLALSDIEKQAFKHVKKLKSFYRDLLVFAVVMALLLVINVLTSPSYWWVLWVFLGWGISFVIRAVFLFGKFGGFSPEWEQRQVDKYLKKNNDLR